MLGADRAQFGHADLEVAQYFQQKRFELHVGAVNLVNEQHDRLVGGQRLQQRPGQQEVLREEHVLLLRQPAGGLGQTLHVAQHVAQGVAQ